MKATSHLNPVDNYQSSNLLHVESVSKRNYKFLKLERLINTILITVEFLLYSLSFLFLYQWRVMPSLESNNYGTLIHASLGDYIILFVVINFVYVTLLTQKHLLNFHRQTNIVDDLFVLLKIVFVSFMIAIGMSFLLKTSVIYSRILIVSYASSMVIIAMLIRSIKIAIIYNLNKRNILTKNILVIGAGKVGEELGEYLSSSRTSGYKLIGYLDDFKTGAAIIGKINDLESVIRNKKIDEIYITIPSERQVINKYLQSIRKYDVNIKIIPEIYDFVYSSIKFQKSEAFPYIEIEKTPLKGVNHLIKRLMDIVLTLIGVVVLSPLFLIIAISIRVDSKGPVFFKQKRIGKNGVPFFMYKFRSMVVNAEELKSKLKKYNEADGPVFKIKRDPRITKVGRFIRGYSLDELPQLFNVLKGDMSLIGPRPPIPEEVEQYSDYQWRRLDICPGISGLWQVSGRSELSFDEWVKLDIYYIEHWSIALDLKILFRTIPVVIKGSGAY